MINCRIVKCADYGLFTLQCGTDKYNLVLEFYDMNTPNIGDELLLNEVLLDKNWENYSQPYAFEKIAINPLKVEELNNNDLIVLRTKEDIFTLKRIYG